MKKRKSLLTAFLLLIASVVALSLMLGLAACGGDGDGGESRTSYSIQAPASSDVYTLTGLPDSAYEGDTVTFKVVLNDPENSSLGDITIEPTFDLSFDVTPAADGTCTFTMPASPVEVIVEAVAYSEVLSDGGVTFSSSNSKTIVVGATNDGYRNDDDDYVECWSYNIGLGWQANGFSSRSYATSSNQSVIPDDAITILNGDKGNNWYFTNAKVAIDTSKISEGTTWLEIYLQNSSSSSSNGTVMVKITVVGTIALQTMQENVTIDFNGYADEGDDITVRFYDQDYIENSTVNGRPAPAYVEVSGVVGADGTADFSFDYIVGHSYMVNVYKGKGWYTDSLTQDNPDCDLVLVIDGDVVGEGSTVTGFDQYKDGKLSFVNANSSLTLEVAGTFREINWPTN